ncbi:MAG: hypothetical protein F4X11_14940 [Acidobacteria bacterium]|nr:hypothetical protein [Acidobacteriota bacterium]
MPQLEHIDAIERRLWSAADTLRANSKYAGAEHRPRSSITSSSSSIPSRTATVAWAGSGRR